MCYAYGSVDQAVNACPMCKVFPHIRCPHMRDICRNRALHPRVDVLYLKNAEVDSFNGCGYCKWARTNPPPKQAGYYNQGWPGCCRAPTASEYKLIQIADWRAVNAVHHTPIPPEIKAALDNVVFRGSPIPPLSTTGSAVGRSSAKTSMPSFDRRNSGNSSPSSKYSGGSSPSSRSNSLSGKSANITVPNKIRAGGSPQQLHASLARTSSGHAISTSVPTSSSMEQHRTSGHRRQPIPEFSEKRYEEPHSSHSSPSRKYMDLENHTSPRRSSSVRRSVPSPTATPASLSNVTSNRSPSRGTSSRRTSLSNTTYSQAQLAPQNLLPQIPSSTPHQTPHSAERPLSLTIPRSSKREEDAISSASSSSGSSDGLGSLSDSTVTSEGAFTDYLSDESEAELQRQAEARAALVAQSQAEELEFKAARQQLAHIDLRPPKSWNPTNITNSAASRSSGTTGSSKPVGPPERNKPVSGGFSSGAMARTPGQTLY